MKHLLFLMNLDIFYIKYLIYIHKSGSVENPMGFAVHAIVLTFFTYIFLCHYTA